MNTSEINLVKELIEEKLGISCKISEIAKGSTIKTGISLGTDAEAGVLIPTVYVEDFKGTPEEIASKIVEAYNSEIKNKIPVMDDLSVITDWSKAKDNLTIVLRKHMDEGVFIRLCTEIDATIKILLPDFNTGDYKASVRVSAEILKRWGKALDEVFQIALNNDSKRAYQYLDMMNFFIGKVSKEPINKIKSISMITVSNDTWINGAAIILQKKIMDNLAEIAGSDLVIIPSSIHECIIMPYTEEMKKVDLVEMIKTVNIQEVSPEEVLSDVPYLYKKGIGVMDFPED